MSFPRLFYIILAFIILAIGFAFTHTFAFPDASWPLDKGERVVVLPGEILTQTFVANRDGLRRVEILFGKFTLSGDAELTLELKDAACSAVLAQKTLSNRSFDSEYTFSFLFDRIPDSAGKTYCLSAYFITNQPVKKNKAPRFFIDEESQAPPHSLTNPGGETSEGPGPVAIRPGHTNATFFGNAQEFFDRISQYKPFFLKSWFLVAFATLGLLLTFAAAALLIKEEEK